MTDLNTLDESDLKCFLEFLTEGPDLFSTDYIGYWARGIANIKGGWLLHTDTEAIEEAEEEEGLDLGEVVREFNTTGKLPEEFKFISLDVAKQIAVKHVENEGSLDYDAGTIDVAIQEVLLGEVVYG